MSGMLEATGRELLELFLQVDTDADDRIDWDQFILFVHNMGIQRAAERFVVMYAC